MSEQTGTLLPWPLQVLSRLMLVWEPANFALAALGAFNAIAVRGWPVMAVLAARLTAAVMCVAAARAVQGRHAGARTLARVALLSSLAVYLFVYATPYFPSNRMPGDALLYACLAIVYYCGWSTYLTWSTRARNILE